MRLSSWILVIILANLVFSLPSANSTAGELIWGKNIGPVSAYIDQIDNAKGLTIRAAPSKDGQIVGYIPLGATIRGSSEFKNGWVKLISPVDTGWVSIDFLKPRPIAGMVKKVDSAELCLPIRAGPAPSYQKVGCAQIGEGVNLTGMTTADKWLQLTEQRGWVDGSSVKLPQVVPQAVKATEVPRVASAGPAVSTSHEKPIAQPAQWRSLTKKGSVSEKKAPAGPPLTSTASAPATTPPPKAAPVKKELPHIACKSGWCVNFDNSQVTHGGKPVSGLECFKNDACAGIVAQHHVTKASLDGMFVFGNFKLLANGVVLDAEAGKLLVNCNKKGSVDNKCIADFLRKTVAGIDNKTKEASVSTKAVKQTAKFNKPATSGSTSRKPKAGKSTPSFSSSFFDQNKSEQEMIDNAWEDSSSRLPGR
jgi:Bacterial SH3 domain